MHLCTLQHRITKMLVLCATVVMLRLNGFCMLSLNLKMVLGLVLKNRLGLRLLANFIMSAKTLGA